MVMGTTVASTTTEAAEGSAAVEAYFQKIAELSSGDLDDAARALAHEARSSTARLIAHLAEIDARREHLLWGYKSLFDYCVRALGLSEGAVWTRIQVAKVCRRFPQVLVALSKGKIHLTAASQLAPHLSEENVDDLIQRAQGRSKRQLQGLLAALAPKPEFEPSDT